MTAFDLDKQTIKDLEIFADNRSAKSISEFYKQVKTFGGKRFLNQVMKNPLTDVVELRQRTGLISFLSEAELDLKINSSQFEFIDHYQRLNIAPLRNNFLDAFLQNLSYRITPNNNYYIIKLGVRQLAYLMADLKEKIGGLNEEYIPEKLCSIRAKILQLVDQSQFKFLYSKKPRISPRNLINSTTCFEKNIKTSWKNYFVLFTV